MKRHFTFAALAVLGATASLPAQFTFAEFHQSDVATDDLVFANNGLGPGSATFTTVDTVVGLPVAFEFLNLNFVGPYAALNQVTDARFLMVSTTSTLAGGSAPFLTQGLDSGFLEFRAVTPIAGLDRLLRVDFTNALVVGLGGAGAMLASEPGSTITFSSDFLTFAPNLTESFSLSLSGLMPIPSMHLNGLLNDFTADGAGTFDAVPTVIPDTVVPEPATSALLFALLTVGVVVRRRQARVIAV